MNARNQEVNPVNGEAIGIDKAFFKRRRTRKQGRGARNKIPVFGIRMGNDVDKPVPKKELMVSESPLRHLRGYEVRLPSKPMRSRGMTASHVAVVDYRK